jgi:hypothetical protein
MVYGKEELLYKENKLRSQLLHNSIVNVVVNVNH